jgi:hypothetical protein
MDKIDVLIKNPIFWVSVLGACVVIYIFTGSFMAVGVSITLVAVGLYLYTLVKVPEFKKTMELIATGPVGVDSSETVSGSKLQPTAGPLREVFYIAGNKYTYEDAAAVCAAYDADLATYEQVQESYSKGAEWCGYGWTLGGMALYPTQEETWKRLQQELEPEKRMRCGRPGVNGGYFDPTKTFGVNCYGVKPGCNNRKYPIPLAIVSQSQGAVTEEAVNKFKQESGKIKIDPFNRNGWSMWGMA